MRQNRFELANLELYSPMRHGFEPNDDDKSIYSKYLILYKFDINEFYDNIEEIQELIRISNDRYPLFTHPIIENYSNMIINPKHLELKIIEPIKIYFGKEPDDYFDTGIDKTIWIKLIQRRWRNYMINKRNKIMKIKNIKYRELYGNWPPECITRFNLGLTKV